MSSLPKSIMKVGGIISNIFILFSIAYYCKFINNLSLVEISL
jgi:hypothetical protein